MSWFVYVLVSPSTNCTYVGAAIDVTRRLAQHNGELSGGARRTQSGRPWSLGTTFGPYADRAEAQRVEHRVKRLRGRARLSWTPERE